MKECFAVKTSRTLKLCVYKTIVLPIALFASEVWTCGDVHGMGTENIEEDLWR